MKLPVQQVLPKDFEKATLVGRAWIPGNSGGPSPVTVSGGKVYDLASVVPTSAQLVNSQNPVRVVRDAIKSGWAKALGDVADVIANSHADLRDPKRPYLLAPCDLQALRACGVT